MIRAVIFDLDDTLVPEKAGWIQAFDDACTACAQQLGDLDELRAAVFDSSLTLWQQSEIHGYCRRVGLGSPSSLLSSYPGSRAEDEFLRRWGPGYRLAAWTTALRDVGLDPQLAGTLGPAFRRSFEKVQAPFDDVARSLRELRGLAFGVLTNGFSDLQRLKLATTGLLNLCDSVVISAEVGIGKPDPRIFRIALDELGIEPTECLMVGDGLEKDVLGASAVRIRSVLLCRNPENQPDWDGPVIQRLTEVLRFLDMA